MNKKQQLVQQNFAEFFTEVVSYCGPSADEILFPIMDLYFISEDICRKGIFSSSQLGCGLKYIFIVFARQPHLMDNKRGAEILKRINEEYDKDGARRRDMIDAFGKKSIDFLIKLIKICDYSPE